MLSVLLSILMILSVWTVPASAFADEGISVTLQTAEITSETSSVSVSLSKVPASGILRVIELDAGENSAVPILIITRVCIFLWYLH